ncbi:MAG: hypothetical protein IT323_21010 [Anaerolineae bacterium]|nr:hypothetical protein [Anaerolineae bacterium]
MDAQIELVTGVVGPDRSVTSIKWGGKVRLRIEEYACGYEAHWSRAYGSDDSPAEVLARFRQRLVGWQVERESEDVIYLKNRDNTARLKLTIIRPRKTPHDDFDFGPSLSSAAPGYATVYEIDLRYGEPHVRIPG